MEGGRRHTVTAMMSGVPAPDLLQTAVRAFTIRAGTPIDHDADAKSESPDKAGRRSSRSRWREALVWDTETVTTPDQHLLVLCWRLYQTEHGAEPVCVEEGFAYPDELETDDPKGYAVLRAFAEEREWAAGPGFSRQRGGRTIRCEPLSWWLEQRLYRHAYVQRDRCDLVGFNLLFDLGRVARYWAPAEGDYFGGWSLGMWGSYTPARQMEGHAPPTSPARQGDRSTAHPVRVGQHR
jgi:hypothetical protein